MKKVALSALVLFLLGATATVAQDVRYDFDREQDFSKYRSYKWVPIKGADEPDELTGRQITSALHDFDPVAVKDNSRRPSVIFVSIGEIRPRIRIDPHGNIALADEIDHRRIPIGNLLHDMTPVAPAGSQIEQDEAPLALGLGKNGIGPRLPGDAAVVSQRSGERQKYQTKENR